MERKVHVDKYETAEHREAYEKLSEFLFELNRASVSLIIAARGVEIEVKRTQRHVVSSQLLSAINTFSSILMLSSTPFGVNNHAESGICVPGFIEYLL